MLNNRTVSYSNIIFWLENSSLINKLLNIENGTLVKEWFEGTKTINPGWVFRNIPEDKIYSTEELLEYNLGIKNIPYFKNYFDRYIRTWNSSFKKGYNGELNEEEESEFFDLYPINVNTFMWISSLSNKDYNVDMLVHDCILGREIDLETYKTKKEAVDVNILTEIISLFPSKVEEYKKGKTNLINLFLGEYLKRLENKNVDKAMLLTGIKTFIEQH